MQFSNRILLKKIGNNVIRILKKFGSDSIPAKAGTTETIINARIKESTNAAFTLLKNLGYDASIV
jgi:hypothetical protein